MGVRHDGGSGGAHYSRGAACRPDTRCHNPAMPAAPSSPNPSADEATVAASLAQALLSVAGELGLDPDGACRSASLDPGLIADADARVPFLTQEALWAALVAQAELVHARDFGLEVGSRTAPGSFNLLGFIAVNSRTLGEAFAHIERYQNIAGGGGRVSVHPVPGGIEVRYTPLHPQADVTRHRVAAVLAAWAGMGRWLNGTFRIEAVQLTAQPPRPEDYRALFGCPVHTGSDRNALRVSDDVLALPIPQASSAALAALRAHADRLLATLSAPARPLSRQVARLLGEQLMNGEPDREAVARTLGMSARTLQRRLQDEGSGFQQLLQETRLALARDYLAQDTLGIAEIGFLLGFSEPSAFFRWFRNATGQTPGQYRASR